MDIEDRDLARFHATLAVMSVRQGRAEQVLRWAIRTGFRLAAWRVAVDLGALPRANGSRAAGCVVVAAPHRAWLEPFLLLAAWPSDAARLVWLADGRAATRSRWRRHLLPRLGVIPIEGRRQGPRTYAALAAAVLARGAAVVIFPEVGAPSTPDRTRRISPGFAYLALSAGAPVVPVVVAGTHRIVRGSSFSLDALDVIETSPLSADVFSGDGRQRAYLLTDQVAAAIAPMLVERNRQTDAQRPRPERWRWLGRLFR